MISTVRAFLVTGLVSLMAFQAFAADVVTPAAPPAVKPAASAVVAKAPVVKKASTSATAISGKTGDNQYPGTVVIPPKPPKKEALDAAALKAQGAAAK